MTDKTTKPVKVDLDHIASRFNRLRQARLDLAELTAFVATETQAVKDELAKLGGTDGLINGAVVVTNRPQDSFRYSEFAEKYPDVYAKYLRPVTVEELDKQALINDHGGLLSEFRATSFLVKK